MAEKKQNKKQNKKHEPTPEEQALKAEKIRKWKTAGGLLLLFTAIYFFLAFTSFFFSGKYDQSFTEAHTSEQLLDNVQRAYNVCGKHGAIVSRYFIDRCFGPAAYILVGLMAICGFDMARNRTREGRTRRFTIAILSTIWCSVASAYFLGGLTDNLFFHIGGIHGETIATWFNAQIGDAGTTLLLTILAVFLLISINNKIIDKIRTLLNKKINIKFKRKAKPEEEETKTTTQTPQEEETPLSRKDDDNQPAEPAQTPPTAEIKPQPQEETPIEENKQTPEEKTAEAKTGTTDEAEPESEAEPEPEFEIIRTQTDAGDENYREPYNPRLDLEYYKFPSLDMLQAYDDHIEEVDMAEQQENKDRITEVLRSFGVEITSIKASVGPTITLYEITPAEGIRISKIRNLEDDIALSLAALGIRIIAPIPGKGTIGIEVPNKKPQIVPMRSVLNSRKFQEADYELPVAMGRTITNEVFMFDLTKAPHMLVAGATGQGKSVGLNAIVTSLLYKKHPSELKFVIIDPKKVEFSIYAPIENHYLAKLPDTEEAIITETDQVISTLNSLCIEMDTRYDLLKQAGCRNIKEYNKKFINRQLNPEKGHHFMPYIVIIIDEFGDLIMTAGKEIELPICRIAQLARAVGIHAIIATQRPTTNIITGTIKANFPARVAFRVAAMMDSRTILDRPGAQQLIGKGDMLYLQGNEPVRVQCAFVDTPEVDKIVSHISHQQGYATAYLLPEYEGEDADNQVGGVDLSRRDELFEEAARMVISNQQGSTSMLQRNFSIGYNRAGRIMDQLEAAGIVGPAQGSKPRDVLCMTDNELDNIISQLP